jgi:hypothetical protein
MAIIQIIFERLSIFLFEQTRFPGLTSVHPEIVDFGSRQGLSVFATTGIV